MQAHKTLRAEGDLPQPVINEKSCAKCRQPAIAGKYSACCKTTKKRKRVKRDYEKGYSGMSTLRERLLLDNYMNKYLKDYIKDQENPKGDSGLRTSEERKVMDRYMKKQNYIDDVDDKRSKIRKAIREKKKHWIPKQANRKNGSISKGESEKRSFIPDPFEEKRGSVPIPTVIDDESKTFEPRPVGSDFHIKVDQLKKK